MGLFKDYVSQTRKPEGFLGKMMVNGMNGGHAKMADWGMSHLKTIDPEQIVEIIEGMKCHTIEEIEDVLKTAGFSKVKSDHHKSKPWITVVARK